TQYLAEKAERRRTLRHGTVRFCNRDGYIIVTPDGWNYEIDLERMKTSFEAFHWLCHLQGKAWFTPQMLSDLVKVIRRTTKLNIYYGKWPT
ncbi:MAG: hypothetical protein WCJ37_19410, partial [Syntrophus sp. (in: bacteria)]